MLFTNMNYFNKFVERIPAYQDLCVVNNPSTVKVLLSYKEVWLSIKSN